MLVTVHNRNCIRVFLNETETKIRVLTIIVRPYGRNDQQFDMIMYPDDS